MITCFDETIKAAHSWPWRLEWLEGCGCWVGYGAAAEAGVSKLRTHFRGTHLFPLSSPDGQKSLSQHPADCLQREYTQIADAQRYWEAMRARVGSTKQTLHLSYIYFFLICFVAFSSLTLSPRPGVLPQLQVAAWGRNLVSVLFILEFSAHSPERRRLRISKDDTDNSVCLLLWRETVSASSVAAKRICLSVASLLRVLNHCWQQSSLD